MDERLVLAEIEKSLDYADRVAPRARWGKSDCLVVPAGILRRAGGPDFGERYKGRYASADDLKTLIPKGLAAEVRARAREHGWKPVKPEDARPGAWGVCRTRQGIQINVLKYRDDYWLAPCDRGVNFIKTSEVRVAWQFSES